MVRRFLWALTARLTRAMTFVPILVRGKGLRAGRQPFSSFLTRRASLVDTVVRPSRRRVRVVGLSSKLCRRNAFWRTIFPVPVRRNRLLAPLWVLALGMCPQFCEIAGLSGGAAGSLAACAALARVFAPR